MSDTNGKAPLGEVNGSGSKPRSARSAEPMVKVQPPRESDLQPSYAQILSHHTGELRLQEPMFLYCKPLTATR